MIYKRVLLSILVFIAFYLAGCIALYIESWLQSMIAGSAVFGISFVSLIGTLMKAWYDLAS